MQTINLVVCCVERWCNCMQLNEQKTNKRLSKGRWVKPLWFFFGEVFGLELGTALEFSCPLFFPPSLSFSLSRCRCLLPYSVCLSRSVRGLLSLSLHTFGYLDSPRLTFVAPLLCQVALFWPSCPVLFCVLSMCPCAIVLLSLFCSDIPRLAVWMPFRGHANKGVTGLPWEGKKRVFNAKRKHRPTKKNITSLLRNQTAQRLLSHTTATFVHHWVLSKCIECRLFSLFCLFVSVYLFVWSITFLSPRQHAVWSVSWMNNSPEWKTNSLFCVRLSAGRRGSEWK